MEMRNLIRETFLTIIWVVGIGLIVAYFFGVFDSGEVLVKPCEGMEGDIWKECVSYYQYEEGWDYDDIINGVIVKKE
jgi:hypothetical protein